MRIGEYLEINRKLKSARTASGIPQKEMAAALGISTSAYSNYENGYSEPPVEVLEAFCQKIDITLPELLELHLQDDVKERLPLQTFTDFMDDLNLMYEMGLEISCSMVAEGTDLTGIYKFKNPQLATMGAGLQEAYQDYHDNKITEDQLKYKISNLRTLYNVKIKEYL